MLELADLVRRVFERVDAVGEHFAVPQVAVDVVLLNLLGGQEGEAEGEAERHHRPEGPAVLHSLVDQRHPGGIQREQAEINRQVSQDGPVAVALAPVELAGKMSHPEIEGQAETA